MFQPLDRDKRLQMYAGLKEWVDKGLNGALHAQTSIGDAPRIRTVFINAFDFEPASSIPQADAVIRLGQGGGSTSVSVETLGPGGNEEAALRARVAQLEHFIAQNGLSAP